MAVCARSRSGSSAPASAASAWAIRLRQEGIDDFTIFERGETVGGVWRANTYPGAACDVPSHLYSFSFAPGHHWSRRYAPAGRDPRATSRTAPATSGSAPPAPRHRGDGGRRSTPTPGRWTLTHRRRRGARVRRPGHRLRPAHPSGDPADRGDRGLRRPRVPLRRVGPRRTTSTGERVAVIGTGASAIQFVPEIAKVAEQLDDLPALGAVGPAEDRPRATPSGSGACSSASRSASPPAASACSPSSRAATYGFTGQTGCSRRSSSVADRERRKAARPTRSCSPRRRPTTEIGCKRVLFTSDWYPTLLRDDVELVTGARRADHRATASSAPTGSSARPTRSSTGTGFQTHNFVAPMEVRGLDGRELNAVWAERAGGLPRDHGLRASRTCSCSTGPNTNHGSGSVPYTLECQFNYVARRDRPTARRGLPLDRPAPRDPGGVAGARWTSAAQAPVWVAGGCHNWYVNRGRREHQQLARPLARVPPPHPAHQPGDYRVAT